MLSSTAETPWVRGNLSIFAPTMRAVEHAAVRAYARGEEACGYLSGPSLRPLEVDAMTEMENLANRYHAVDPEGHPRTGRDYFKIDSMLFDRELERGRVAGRPAKVFFHSHVDHGAYFSQEDAASITEGGRVAPAYPLAYLVTAVHRGVVTAHCLFCWEQDIGRFSEASFAIIRASS